MNRDSRPSFFSAILGGIIATVVGGLILALLLGDGPFKDDPILTPQLQVNDPAIGQSQQQSESLNISIPEESTKVTTPLETMHPEAVETPTQIPLPFTALELPFVSDKDDINSSEWITAGPYNDIHLVGNPAWSNYVVDIDASTRVRSHFGYHISMVLIHIQDLDNHVRFVIDCPDGVWWEMVKAQESNRVVGTINNNSPEVCDQFHLQLRAVDGDYEAYINGELRSAFTDHSFTTGYIGLSSYPKVWEGSIMDFNNLVVSAP